MLWYKDVDKGNNDDGPEKKKRLLNFNIGSGKNRPASCENGVEISNMYIYIYL